MKIKAEMLFKAGKITSSLNSESRTSRKTEASSMAEWETVAFSWLCRFDKPPRPSWFRFPVPQGRESNIIHLKVPFQCSYVLRISCPPPKVNL